MNSNEAWMFFAAAALHKTINGEGTKNCEQDATEAAKYADAMLHEYQKREFQIKPPPHATPHASEHTDVKPVKTKGGAK